jgi:hypothetical protein
MNQEKREKNAISQAPPGTALALAKRNCEY